MGVPGRQEEAQSTRAALKGEPDLALILVLAEKYRDAMIAEERAHTATVAAHNRLMQAMQLPDRKEAP